MLSLLNIDQPQIRLIYKCRGPQGLTGILLGHPDRGQLAQFLVDQRQKLLGR